VTFKDVNIEDSPGTPERAGCRPSDPRRALGDAGEDLVANWYADAGYRVLDRNCAAARGSSTWSSPRLVLVFCEVKTRRTTAFGSPPSGHVTNSAGSARSPMRWLDAHPERAPARCVSTSASVSPSAAALLSST